MKHLADCPICNAPIEKSDVICPECRAVLDNECFDAHMARCPMCLYPKVSGDYICDQCLGGIYNRVFPVSSYDGPLSYTVIYNLKFHGHKELAPVVAMYLKRALDVLDPDNEALLVPVPCSADRMKLLGWNPMVEVCKVLDRPYEELIINSGNRTVQQKRLNRAQRLGSAAGRFAINPPYKDRLDEFRDRRIIVVDDIVTTMSTMNSAIALLRSNSFSDVSGASWLCEL